MWSTAQNTPLHSLMYIAKHPMLVEISPNLQPSYNLSNVKLGNSGTRALFGTGEKVLSVKQKA